MLDVMQIFESIAIHTHRITTDLDVSINGYTHVDMRMSLGFYIHDDTYDLLQ